MKYIIISAKEPEELERKLAQYSIKELGTTWMISSAIYQSFLGELPKVEPELPKVEPELPKVTKKRPVETKGPTAKKKSPAKPRKSPAKPKEKSNEKPL